jgi:hypothetical protein
LRLAIDDREQFLNSDVRETLNSLDGAAGKQDD